jgi:hypothetical protein
VLKVIAPQELAKNLDPILDALEERGTTLIIKKHEQPVALLLRFDAYVAMLATMDYSGWERWIDEVRRAFPEGSIAPPRRPKSIIPAVLDPADIGYAPARGQVGTAAGRRRLAEELGAMGVQLDDRQLGAAYSLLLSLAERKRVLYPEDLRLAADEALGRGADGPFILEDFETHVVRGTRCTASVTLQMEGGSRTGRASGSGPLDAAYTAIAAMAGIAPELEDFSLASASRGSDAQGEAVVTLSHADRVVVGRAVSTDIIEAGIRAYLNALNWLVRAPRTMAASPAS